MIDVNLAMSFGKGDVGHYPVTPAPCSLLILANLLCLPKLTMSVLVHVKTGMHSESKESYESRYVKAGLSWLQPPVLPNHVTYDEFPPARE